MEIEDCLEELVVCCNDQLTQVNAGPRLAPKVQQFKACAKQHRKRCGSHCWILMGLREMDTILSTGNIVIGTDLSAGYSFSRSSTRELIEQAVKVIDAIKIHHPGPERICPFTPGVRSPDFPIQVVIPEEIYEIAIDYYRRIGDEGYDTDKGNMDTLP